MRRASSVPVVVTFYAAAPAPVASEMTFLTISNTRALVKAAPFNIEQFDQMASEYEHIGLPGFALSIGYVKTSHIVALVIVLSLLWFLLHQREAQLSTRFPSSGTLFAVFSRTSTSRMLFRALLLIPSLASVLLASAILRATTNIDWSDRLTQMILCSASVLCTLLIAGSGVTREKQADTPVVSA
jgi:hypothetical protein